MSLFCFFKWSTPIFLSPCLQFIDWLFSITEGPKLGFSETALLTAKGETLCFSQIIILYQYLISVLKCVDNKKESIIMWFDKKQRIVTWCVQYSWNLSFRLSDANGSEIQLWVQEEGCVDQGVWLVISLKALSHQGHYLFTCIFSQTLVINPVLQTRMDTWHVE